MPSTTYFDPPFKVWAMQTRTDEDGVDVIDSDAVEGRLPWSMFTPGVRGEFHFAVSATGANMSVDVGSGTAFNDLAIVAGLTPGQGNYGVMLEEDEVNLTIPAADLTNPAIHEVYLAIVDNPGSMVKPRLALRVGDAASSPTVPGPDAVWDGYLLLATVSVTAGAVAITSGDISDVRPIIQVAPGLVGNASLTDGAVQADNIALQAVTTNKLANLAVTEGKLADGAVTNAKLGSAAVTAAKIAGGAVGTSEIANDAVTNAKLASDGVPAVLLGGTTGTPSLTSSDAVLLSDTVPVPSDWASWTVVVTVAGRYAIVGTVSSVRLYIRPGPGLDGPFNDFNFTPDGNNMPFAVTLIRSGLTATGGVVMSLRGSKTGAGTVTLPAASMSVVAVRTS